MNFTESNINFPEAISELCKLIFTDSYKDIKPTTTSYFNLYHLEDEQIKVISDICNNKCKESPYTLWSPLLYRNISFNYNPANNTYFLSFNINPDIFSNYLFKAFRCWINPKQEVRYWITQRQEEKTLLGSAIYTIILFLIYSINFGKNRIK